MIQRWTTVNEMYRVHLTQVFAGGACNIMDEQGILQRNAERDRINDWLTEQKIVFFDPQIHLDTHGEDYDYGKHHPLELAARQAAKVNLYEISPFTFGGITSLEIAIDHLRRREPTVIYYSDGDANQDVFPPHTPREGYPLFTPKGIRSSAANAQAHYREFRKAGNLMRRYILNLAGELETLTVTFGGQARKGELHITPTRIHAVDLFTAAIRAAGGKRVVVNFPADKGTMDDKGFPLFVLPDHPAETQLYALLDQYVDQGCALRRAIAELVEIGVYLRVVYTQQSAILALEEMLRAVGIKPYPHSR